PQRASLPFTSSVSKSKPNEPEDGRGEDGRIRYLLRRRAERRLFFFFGTLPPARRACDRPIAIACLRLFTFLPERPDLSVPRFRSCIARLTLLCAFLPYLAMCRLGGPNGPPSAKSNARAATI